MRDFFLQNEELSSSIVANADQSNTEESSLHIFRQENNEELAQNDLKPTNNEKKRKIVFSEFVSYIYFV
ncbi:unnamed protein product [Rotaria sp. Silwood2]|nr:unnamed protein product [Rotaria sp. Silwood2]CAF4486165.1 unnamed protein product [Rotaria sp. Silwood2]